MTRKKTRKPEPGPQYEIALSSCPIAARFLSTLRSWRQTLITAFTLLEKKVGKPSFYGEFIKRLPKPLRDEFLERSNYIQNFAKHGFMDLEEAANWGPKSADALMMFSADCCQFIYGAVTPLMRLLRMRFYFENPGFAPKEHQDEFWKGALIHGMGSGSRKEFFDNVGKRLLESLAPHLRKPPELESP